MRTIITGLVVFAGWAVISNYIYVCHIKNLCTDEAVAVVISPPNKVTADTTAIIGKVVKDTKALEQAIEETIILFAFDTTLVLNKQELQRVSDQLSQLKSDELLLEGHTCNIGTAAYNYDLGKRRAETVKKAFIAYGLAAESLKTVSEGETKPRVPNTSPEKREMNRRVELIIKE